MPIADSVKRRIIKNAFGLAHDVIDIAEGYTHEKLNIESDETEDSQQEQRIALQLKKPEPKTTRANNADNTPTHNQDRKIVVTEHQEESANQATQDESSELY